MKYSKKNDKKKKYLNTIKINKMQKGFYNRVMTSNRVLNNSKSQPVIQPAKINNGEKLKFVPENVEKNVLSNQVTENESFASVLLENRVNHLENVIQALLSKNVEIEQKLNEIQLLHSTSVVHEDVENTPEEIEMKENVNFELKEFDTIVEEN